MSVEDPNQKVHAVSRLCGASLVNFNRCLQRRSRHSTRMWPSTGSSQPKHLGSDPANTNLYQRKKGCKGALFGFSLFSFMFNSHLAILAHSYLDVGRCHFADYQDMETDAVTLPGNGVGLHGLVDLRRPAVHAVQLVCVCACVWTICTDVKLLFGF